MEDFYNELQHQFHHNTDSHNFTAKYKNISRELVSLRTNKKQQLLAYKQELSILTANNSHKENSMTKNSFYRQPLPDHSNPTASQQETQRINGADLKKTIINMEQEIAVLRQKTSQVTNSLNLIQNKKDQIAQIKGELELGAFHRNQRFIIQANFITRRERSRKETLNKLQHRHRSLQEEIIKLVKLRKHQQLLKEKWQMSRQIKTNRNRQTGINTKQLYIILRNLYFLVKLNQSYKKGQYFDQQLFFKDELPNKDGIAMSRSQVLNYFKERGIDANPQQIDSIVQLYREQQYQFDRNQRANQQVAYCLQNQQATLQNLQNTFRSLHKQRQECMMHNVKQRQLSLKKLESTIRSNCIFIINASTQLSQLIHKLHSFRKTLTSSLHSINKQPKIKQQGGNSTTTLYRKLLNRNCEQAVLSWKKGIKKQNCFYSQIIEKNDMLRIYAQPENYKSEKDELYNYENIFTLSFERARTFLMQMLAELMSNLNEKCIFKGPKYESPTTCNGICVESTQYVRRDDFRFIEEQEQQQEYIPPIQSAIDSNFDSQLMPSQHRNSYILPSSSYQPASPAHRLQMKYTDLDIRRKQNIQNTSTLRKMLSRLNSLNSSRSNTLRIPKSPFNSISSPNICRTVRATPQQKSRINIFNK